MSPCFCDGFGSVEPLMRRHKAQGGFSLIEVLMCLTMMALIMLPFTILMTQTGQVTRGAYLQSTRTILLNSLKSELSPGDPSFATTFTDGSMNTTVTDTGQTMPYMRVVDTTTAGATNSLKRTTLFYLYTNSSDATSAPRYKTDMVQYPKVFRIRFGLSTGVIDADNRYWYGDGTLYNSANKIPGQLASYSTSNYSGNDILNTSNNDDLIYQPERTVGTDNFYADVANGAYTVKIYMCETTPGRNATNSRRVMNFYLEGIKVNTDGPYSTYESTGGTNFAEVKMYDVNVTDGTLNFTCSVDSSSNDPNCNVHGLEIIKRDQP